MDATDTERERRSRREGRGQLSSIDTLPEECDEDIAWANEALRERDMPGNEILRQFNARLADKGVKGVSKSAFSRHSVRLAIEVRKMEATRKITDEYMARLAPGDRTDGMIAATELLKHRILQMVMDDEADLKLLNVASLALQRLSSTGARQIDVQRREKADQRDEEARAAQEVERQAAIAKEAEQAAEAVTKIATEVGLSADRVRELRRGVLGLAV